MRSTVQKIQRKTPLSRWLSLGLTGLGAALVVGAFIAGHAQPSRWMLAYHLGFIFCLSLSLGGLFFVLIHAVLRSRWPVVFERVAITIASNFWLLSLLAIPVLWNSHHVFSWMSHEHYSGIKALYMGRTFFTVRSMLYLGLWTAISTHFFWVTIRQDDQPNNHRLYRLSQLAGPYLVVLAVTTTLASIDWIMALNLHWQSAVFGVYFFSGAVISGTASVVIVAIGLKKMGHLPHFSASHLHDLGKWLVTFVLFWGFIAFSQYFVIWYANLAEEIAFYVPRTRGYWGGVSIALMAGHFFLPLVVLLSRQRKRQVSVQLITCFGLLVAHFLDMAWLILPTLPANGTMLWMDIGCALGMACMFFGWVFRRLAYINLTPQHDPRLAYSIRYES